MRSRSREHLYHEANIDPWRALDPAFIPKGERKEADVVCFEAMIKEVKSFRLNSCDLEAKLTLSFRPKDLINKEAMPKLSEMITHDQEVTIVVMRWQAFKDDTPRDLV